MKKNQLHEFHFVMDIEMKHELQGLDIFKNTKSLSGIIVKILTLFVPALKDEHKWGTQRNSRYKPVIEDPDQVREHVHVYIPENLYRLLKIMHADLNFYSIAQMIRMFLRIFLDFVYEYGKKIFKKIKTLFKRWNEENENNKLPLHKIIRQLWRIIRHIPRKNRLISIYDGHFSPFWIFHL